MASTLKRGGIAAFSGADLSGRTLPLLEMASSKRGPLLWLTAAVHGDEVTGIEVLHRLFEMLPRLDWRGRIKAIPGCNPTAFGANERRVPQGHEDMNRIFPGDPTGSVAARTAHAVYTAIAEDRPVAHLDLHTDSVASVPYAILDRALTPAVRPQLALAEKLAIAGGLDVMFDWPLDEYRKLHLDRSLSGAILNQAKIPSFTMELGPTRVAEERFVKAGVTAVCAAMRVLGMLSEKSGPPTPPPRREPRRYRLPGLTIDQVGLLRFAVLPGDDVQAGAKIATLVDLTGQVLETVKAPLPGRVISLAERVVGHPGMTVATLAVEEGLPRKSRRG